jgi:hypothetical protein
MKRMGVGLAAFCLAALLAAGGSAQEKKDQADRFGQTDVPSFGTQPITAQVSTDILIHFVDEPSRHLGLARDRFMDKDYAKSAAEIRKSVAFMKLELAQATEAGRGGLADAIGRLEKLAASLESGTAPSSGDLDAALAQAEQALAVHHELKAEQFWRANDYVDTGHDLRAASMNLGNALKYAGKTASQRTEAAIKDAHKIGDDLRQGNHVPDPRIGASLDGLSNQIDEVAKELPPPKK